MEYNFLSTWFALSHCGCNLNIHISTSKMCTLCYSLLAPVKSAYCGILTIGTSKICLLWTVVLTTGNIIYTPPLLRAIYQCKIPGCQSPKSRTLSNNIWHKNPKHWLLCLAKKERKKKKKSLQQDTKNGKKNLENQQQTPHIHTHTHRKQTNKKAVKNIK